MFERINEMFKRLSSVIVTITLMLTLILPIQANATGISVVIDGQVVSFTQSSGFPYIDSANRTQVPFRQAIEQLGANVIWDQSSQTAIAEKDGITVKIPIGTNYIYKNNIQIPNDTVSTIKDDRVYLPIRVVLEAFGAKVNWNQVLHLVDVTSNNFTSINVISNFGKNPATSRNFTWHTSTSANTGVVEYCEMGLFKGFDGDDIIRVAAQNYDAVTNLDKRVIHKVELSNLKPGTEYIYRVGDAVSGFSSIGEFKTAEENISNFTFIDISDIQATTLKGYDVWKNTLNRALQNFPDARFLVLTGDIVDDGQNISQWDYFSETARNDLLNLPLAPVVGNHDALNTKNTNPNAKNFTDRFDLIKDNTGLSSGTVYSFDYGNAHVAIMNTQCSSEDLKKEADWLRKDMSNTKKQWKIVALHRGPYGSYYDTVDIRSAWVPVFDEIGVDLVLQGHDHNYSRSFPMKNNNIMMADKGTVYITGNTGGVKFYPATWRKWQAVDMQPYTQMYLAITVNDSKMTIGAYDIKGNLKDSIVLQKTH
jgi:3',5'-cyclic AMP phosphodiesterase CpdA